VPEHDRTKPRVTIVLSPEVHAAGKRLAEADGRSFSSWVERLIVEASEAAAPRRKPRKA
jgi:hypothetical protein